MAPQRAPDHAGGFELPGTSDQGGARTALVPAARVTRVDPRPGRAPVVQTTHVTVTTEGIVFCTDYTAGLVAARYSP